MPGWLLSALGLLAPFAGRGALLARRAAPAVAGGVVGAGLTGGLGIPGVDIFPEDRPRRRRRRRALTASDRADIAFITGLLGASAGKNFALTVATRT